MTLGPLGVCPTAGELQGMPLASLGAVPNVAVNLTMGGMSPHQCPDRQNAGINDKRDSLSDKPGRQATGGIYVGAGLSPVSHKLAQWIRQWEFVDMNNKLLPEVQLLGEAAEGKSSSKRPTVIDILTWVQCFAIYICTSPVLPRLYPKADGLYNGDCGTSGSKGRLGCCTTRCFEGRRQRQGTDTGQKLTVLFMHPVIQERHHQAWGVNFVCHALTQPESVHFAKLMRDLQDYSRLQIPADWGGGSCHRPERSAGYGMRTGVDSHSVITPIYAACVGGTTKPLHANGPGTTKSQGKKQRTGLAPLLKRSYIRDRTIASRVGTFTALFLV